MRPAERAAKLAVFLCRSAPINVCSHASERETALCLAWLNAEKISAEPALNSIYLIPTVR